MSGQAKPINSFGSSGLYSKLLAVMKDCAYIQKDKRNPSKGYNYASEAAVKAKVGTALCNHGVLFLPTVAKVIGSDRITTSKGYEEIVTTVEYGYKFVDVETGECHEGVSVGSGSDSADKGIYKALTGATKYVFFGTFLVETGDDPEADDRPDPEQQKGSKEAAQEVLARKRAEPMPVQPDPFTDKKVFAEALKAIVSVNQSKIALTQLKQRIEEKFGKEYGVIAIANAKASVGIPNEATVFDASLGDQKKVAVLLFDELQRSTPTQPEKDGEDGNLLDYLEGIKADDIPSTLEVFKALKGHLFQTMGDGPGAFVYQSILKSYGVAHANGFKGEAKMEDARKAATEIYKKLQEELKKPILEDCPR